MNDQDRLKQAAAREAVKHLRSGMIVGLGTGTTARFVLMEIAGYLQSGVLQDITGIPSSMETEILARELKIPIGTLNDHPLINVTIDGADEVDPRLNMIKGGGGALVREKVLAQASQTVIITVDESKLSPCLGHRRALPVEVLPFALSAERRFLEGLGAQVSVRKNESGYFASTDQDNYILDANLGEIQNPARFAEFLNERAGIVGHGLFIQLATEVIVAGNNGLRTLYKD